MINYMIYIKIPRMRIISCIGIPYFVLSTVGLIRSKYILNIYIFLISDVPYYNSE